MFSTPKYFVAAPAQLYCYNRLYTAALPPMGPANTPSPPPTAIRRTSGAGGSTSGSIVLEKYQLGRLLGRGSFAKVYHAQSLDDAGIEVAVKVIDKSATVDAAMEPRILREISAMCRLRHHPNVLRLHEVMATKSKIYLVMELAHGGDLAAKLSRSRKFTEPQARRYFQQVVTALRFCHQHGIAHRDVKPQNILLDRDGVLKITDFGLSALAEQKIDGLTRTACGTPGYTAPEVISRKGYDGEKADAWSCGVLLFLFLAGYLPFDDANLASMYRAIHRGAYNFPDCVSKPAKFIIYRLLDPNPTTRLTLDELVNLSWFKKSLSKNNSSTQTTAASLFESEYKKGADSNLHTVNAFDIISMSSGLNLSGLFEAEMNKKVLRFTSGLELLKIEEELVKTGEGLGYRAGRGKSGGIFLSKGVAVVLAVEIWQVAAELWLAEMSLVEGGAGEVQWEELKSGLDGIALSWPNEAW